MDLPESNPAENSEQNADEEPSRPMSNLMAMCIKGRDYREEQTVEMFGEEATVVFKPILDEEFLPLVAFIKIHMGLDGNDDAIEAARDEIESNRDESGKIDVSKLDREFVVRVKEAIVYGVAGSYDDTGALIDHDEEMNRRMIDMMVGGYSVELGMRALEVSGNLRDATKFRGSRGGQRGFSSE
jgi:hypothetical protein